MNVSLTPELESFVQEKVQSGLYTSASEVIRESLRLMHMHDSVKMQKFAALNADISLGLADLDAGKSVNADDSYAKMKKKIAKRGRRG